jgi:hypothetical protein
LLFTAGVILAGRGRLEDITSGGVDGLLVLKMIADDI